MGVEIDGEGRALQLVNERGGGTSPQTKVKLELGVLNFLPIFCVNPPNGDLEMHGR